MSKWRTARFHTFFHKVSYMEKNEANNYDLVQQSLSIKLEQFKSQEIC